MIPSYNSAPTPITPIFHKPITMRFSTLSTAIFAAGALAGPIKRAVVYQTEVDNVFVTQYTTVDAAAATPAPAANVVAQAADDSGSDESVAVVYTTVEAPAAAPTQAPAHHPAPPPYQPPAYTPHAYTAPAPAYTPPAPSSVASVVVVTPSSSSAAAAAATLAASSVPVGNVYQQMVLLHHNIHRANHSAPDVAWDDDLAASAQIVADTCVYAHKVDVNGGGYGQNIAAGPHSADVGEVLTGMFYNGEMCFYEDLYGQESPSMDQFDSWGHFSQMVWSGTTHVGCATKDCSSQGLGNVGSDVPPYFTVCNYKSAGKLSPVVCGLRRVILMLLAGNMAGEYGSNINKPLGHASVDGSYKGN